MITKTDEGWAVIAGDTHIGPWIAENKRLDIQEGQLLPFCCNIPENGVVVDAGAHVGTTAATFSKVCGKLGWIYAFEPNPEAYECLRENAKRLNGVIAVPYGLGAEQSTATVIPHENSGAVRLELSEDPKQGVLLVKLDEYELPGRLNFLKIDTEGFETDVLDGAKQTILRDKPDMLIEINAKTLGYRRLNRYDIFTRLVKLGYKWQITDPRIAETDEQYDIWAQPL